MFKVKRKLGGPKNIQKSEHTFIKLYTALFSGHVKRKENEKQQIDLLILKISESRYNCSYEKENQVV